MRSLWHGLVVNQPFTPRREQTGFPHHNKKYNFKQKVQMRRKNEYKLVHGQRLIDNLSSELNL